ncbi:hypothetical protein ACFXHA_37670 [Nocardia sp. NPDC059240]|uniref:hypothetical protein n=1 Tax=Nocardia sp. NPDC059240 TaxID=3346786 RepID=UPI0036A296D1
MSNYNVLADLITNHTDQARARSERIMRAAAVKAHAAVAKAEAKAADQSAPQHLSKSEIKQLRAEAAAQAAQLRTDLRAQAARLAADLGAKA